MRSIRLLAVATTVLVLGSACGGDDPPTGGGENQAPVADFTPPTTCVAGAVCNFTSTGSSDDKAVTTYSWDFDAAGTAPNATTSSASYTFTAAGDFPVTLTVGDAEGLTGSVTKTVTVAAAPVENVLPVAAFELTTACTEGTPCGFHSLSGDADGTIATLAWDFGDATPPGAGIDVTHTFAAAGTYTVTLTVTDNLGGTGTVSQPITVAQAASQDCTTTSATRSVDCNLTIGIRSTVKFTVVSEDCDFGGNRLEIVAPPINQSIFFNLCNQTAGAEKTVTTGVGSTTPLVFEAGTVLKVRFVAGSPDPITDPPASDPGVQVDGTSPSWTLNIDDGGLAGTEGEPDFNDAVINIVATAAP